MKPWARNLKYLNKKALTRSLFQYFKLSIYLFISVWFTINIDYVYHAPGNISLFYQSLAEPMLSELTLYMYISTYIHDIDIHTYMIYTYIK